MFNGNAIEPIGIEVKFNYWREQGISEVEMFIDLNDLATGSRECVRARLPAMK